MTNAVGTYTVTVMDDHDCRITADFIIEEPDEIYVLPIGNRTICQGQSSLLTTQATGGTPYYDFHWSGTDGTEYNSNQWEVGPLVTTTYSLVVTDSHDCSSTPRTSIVTVHPDLEILSVLTSNDTICPGDPAKVYVDVEGGNGGPYLMTLQNGTVVPSPFNVYPDTTTMFYITLEDMCGTPSVLDSINIIVRNIPGNIFVVEDVDGCPPFAAYFTEETPDMGQTYLWRFGDDGFSTDKSPIHIYEEPGVYTVTLEVTDDFGCLSTRTVENMVEVYQGPTSLFEATPEIVSMLAPEIEFINYSVEADNYYWFFGDGDSSLFVSPRHLYPTIGEYEVILVAETANSCRDTTSRVIIVRNEFAFYMPTSFTPNGDGMNDCFRPCGNGIDKNTFYMIVYDRWGNLVYESDKFDSNASCDACTNGSWDGTDNGSRVKGDEILPNGLYHWYCEFHDWNETLYKEQGTVTLIR
jgi:gliding motility-associated-like protein